MREQDIESLKTWANENLHQNKEKFKEITLNLENWNNPENLEYKEQLTKIIKDTLELRRKEHREITEDIQEIRNKNSLTNSIIRVLGYNVSAEAEGKVLPSIRVAYVMRNLIKRIRDQY